MKVVFSTVSFGLKVSLHGYINGCFLLFVSPLPPQPVILRSSCAFLYSGANVVYTNCRLNMVCLTFWYHIFNEFFRKISRLSSWLDFILILFATSSITFCDESDFLENGKQGYLCMKNGASKNLYAPRSHRWLLCLLCIVFPTEFQEKIWVPDF